MTRVKKGFIERVVCDGDVDDYLKLGYIVIDNSSHANDTSKLIERLNQTINQQATLLEKLNGENVELKLQLAVTERNNSPK